MGSLGRARLPRERKAGGARWAHHGLVGQGHAHAVVVGLEHVVAEGHERVADVDRDAAGHVGARVPGIHLPGQQ